MDLRALLAGLTSAACRRCRRSPVSAAIHRGYARRRVRSHSRLPGGWPRHIAEAKARGAVCVLSREPVQERHGPPCRTPAVRWRRSAHASTATRTGNWRWWASPAPTAKPPPPVWCATSSDRRWGWGGPDRHHPEPDRRDGAGDGAHYPGVLRRLPPAAADG